MKKCLGNPKIISYLICRRALQGRDLPFSHRKYHRRMLRRSLTPVRRLLARSIGTCPPPEYDTGCTYCMPDMSMFPEPTKPTPPVPLHWKHVVMNTGTSDWPSRIQDTKGSLAEALTKHRRTFMDRPVILHNSDLPTPENKLSAHLFPENLFFSDIPYNKVPEFIRGYLVPDPDVQCREMFKPQRSTRPMVLICGHTRRDERCGIIAPMLAKEFKAVAEKNGIELDVGICSHVGGHAFAGNVIYHDGKGGEPIWYVKVFPHHVQGIFNETILKGEVIESLARPY
ncbi:hypothetical protein TRVA0_016S01794 [Trichomonascus vanleenenianus]|uniref:Aim32p n=1 Tax=Trichomonascus vanleenenianus TaxID=2268995 RepID=UPI003EC96896